MRGRPRAVSVESLSLLQTSCCAASPRASYRGRRLDLDRAQGTGQSGVGRCEGTKMTNDSDDFDEKMKRSRIALEVSFRELDARLFAIEFHIRQLLGESDPATRDRIVADTK